MIGNKIKSFLFLIFISLNFGLTNANLKYIFSDDIKLKKIDNFSNNFKINVNWENLELNEEQFEYYKLVHSVDNPDVKYENENYIWYSDDINESNIIQDNFTDYDPNLEGINYYRICITTTIDKIYCSKNPLVIDLASKNIQQINNNSNLKINQEESQIIEPFVKTPTQNIKNNTNLTKEISYNRKTTINTNNTTDGLSFSQEFFLYLIIISIISFITYYISKKRRILKESKIYNNQNEYFTNYKENILQILKSENEYIIEYNSIYNKGIKVLETNKNNITKSIYNYVNSISKLQNRGKNLFEELNNLDIKIPDLKESGNTIYRLYIPENIRESFKKQTQKESLVIKTDEQEIPWEIMHDGENFLSLKYPIARKIMTRESIRKNSFKKNKIPKILFITNPTSDLNGTIKETEEIINKLGTKAKITVISGKEASCIKVFSFFGQNDFDIIHYSGHAYFDEKNPENSGLILNDSIITTGEIKRVINGNPLIFLNACSSGRNDEKDFDKTGEDTIGIASSFIIGGAKGVISTLWPVSDSVSSSFALEFYNLFLKNETIGNALLFAKKEVYINYPNDITWASFIYYGDLNLKISN